MGQHFVITYDEGERYGDRGVYICRNIRTGVIGTGKSMDIAKYDCKEEMKKLGLLKKQD